MQVKELIKELEQLKNQNAEVEILLDGQIVGAVTCANEDDDGAYIEADNEDRG